MANDTVEIFHNSREKHDCYARSGVHEWIGADSDIVCFVSEVRRAPRARALAAVVEQVKRGYQRERLSLSRVGTAQQHGLRPPKRAALGGWRRSGVGKCG